jgi:hypothetical protein
LIGPRVCSLESCIPRFCGGGVGPTGPEPDTSQIVAFEFQFSGDNAGPALKTLCFLFPTLYSVRSPTMVVFLDVGGLNQGFNLTQLKIG